MGTAGVFLPVMGQGQRRRSRLGIRLHTASLVTCTAGLFAACGDDDETPQSGGLVIGLQTNLSLPDDIDTIELDVESSGKSLLSESFDFDSTPDILLPAYFTVRAGPSAPIHVTVRATQGGVARTLRQITTMIPAGRVALLQVPIDWLCYDVDGTGDEPYVCSGDETCIAGECADSYVDPDSLPDYVPRDGGGECFDTVACFSEGTAATVDLDSCSIEGATNRTSVALVTKAGSRGICAPGYCLIPLDASSAFGWHRDGGKIEMPDAVCDRLQNDDAAVTIVTTTACDQKTEELPTCGPWSSAGGRATFDAGLPEGISFEEGGPGPGDAGLDATMGTGGAPGMDAGAGGTPAVDAGAGGASGMDATVDVSAPTEASLPDASVDASVEAALEASTCAPSATDQTPPTLLSAALISPDEVLLTFSEPVAVPTRVDPQKFRLSFGEATNAEGAYTYYTDLGYVISDIPAYQFVELTGTCTDQLIARLADPLPTTMCQEIESRVGPFTVEIGLFLHFLADGTPTIEDPSGNALQSIAESWASPALVDGSPTGPLPNFDRVSGTLPAAPVSVSLGCSDAGFVNPG